MDGVRVKTGWQEEEGRVTGKQQLSFAGIVSDCITMEKISEVVEAAILMLIQQHKQIWGTVNLECHQDASGLRTTDLEIERETRGGSSHLPWCRMSC